MNLLRALPVKIKLPLTIVGLCLATGIVLQVVNSLEFEAENLSRTQDQFHSVSEARHKALVRVLHENEINLLILANSPDVSNALGALGSSFRLLPDAKTVLQQAYIDSNPNPAGKRQDLVKAEGPEGYHHQHATFHPVFHEIQQMRNLYDIFLFDADMNNVYTVFKEPDFAATFKEGPLAETGLGVALHKAEQADPGVATFSDFSPYAPSNGTYAAFVVTRVESRAGNTMGYVAFQLNTDDLANIVDDRAGLGDTGGAFLIGLGGAGKSQENFVLGTDKSNRVADDVTGVVGILDTAKVTPQIASIAAGQEGFFEDVMLADGQIGDASVRTVDYNGIKWGLVVERDGSDLNAAANALILKLALIGLVMAAAVVVAGVYLSRSITNPLDRISKAVDSIANGDLQVNVVDADRTDEMGVIANSLNGLLDKLTVAKLAEEERERLQSELRHVVESLSNGLQDLAEGNLTRPLNEDFANGYDGLRLDFNTTLETLSATIVQVVDASQNIRARSTEISTASEDLSRRTENQAAALEETAAALDELTASVKSAAEGAREVEGIVRQARKSADDSGIVVQGAVAAMAEIEKSSEQISQIIGAIDDIAFQTNLLALNAGVEAARAGDAGKGFAVVASEVRALAQRSSAAAKEIKTLIAASAQHVGRGVDQVGKAGEALHAIVGSVANISTLVSTIAAGAVEQSTGLAEINIGVTQLDQVTQQNAAMVEESTAASHSLHQDAIGLAALVSRFIVTPGNGSQVSVVALSQFVPTGFAGSDTPPTDIPPDIMVDMPMAPVKSAGTTNKAMWQEF